MYTKFSVPITNTSAANCNAAIIPALENRKSKKNANRKVSVPAAILPILQSSKDFKLMQKAIY